MFQYVRTISFFASAGYHKEGTRIQDMFPLEGDDDISMNEAEVERTKKLMDDITEKYRQKYNR